MHRGEHFAKILFTIIDISISFRNLMNGEICQSENVSPIVESNSLAEFCSFNFDLTANSTTLMSCFQNQRRGLLPF